MLACNYDPNEMQKCKCLCVRSSLLLWGAAAASVVDDTCHAAAAGRQNGDMLWEWGGKQGGELGHTKVIPVSSFGNAALNTQKYTFRNSSRWYFSEITAASKTGIIRRYLHHFLTYFQLLNHYPYTNLLF